MVAIQYDSIGFSTQIAVTIQESTHVTSCCYLLAPVRQLSSNSWSARMSFSRVQRVFIVEHYLASRSYLTCQNLFRDTFPDSPVQNKSTVSRLANRFRDTGSVRNSLPGCIKHEENSGCMHRWTRWTFPTLNITLFFVFWFQCNLFFDNRTCVRNVCVTFRSPCMFVSLPESGHSHNLRIANGYVAVLKCLGTAVTYRNCNTKKLRAA
jgi:hypothetical protein